MFDKAILAEKLKLYLVCGEGETDNALYGKVGAALEGGVTAVQLRLKSRTSREIFDTAKALVNLTKQHGALFIINDRLDIALACCADGVHLGQSDLPVGVARKIVPENFIIGGSARTRHQALETRDAGADYIGCGSAFPTATKTDAVVIGPSGIKDAACGIGLPYAAIGGITLENLHRLAGCGCSGIAVVSEIMSSPNPRERAQRLAEEINSTIMKRRGVIL